jgi:hypothetical protein
LLEFVAERLLDEWRFAAVVAHFRFILYGWLTDWRGCAYVAVSLRVRSMVRVILVSAARRTPKRSLMFWDEGA